MVKTIRHTLLLLTALCLLAACNEQEPKTQGQSSAMEFDVAGLTRAQSTTAQTITQSPFAIFGDMAFLGSGSPLVIFYGSDVTYDGSGWKYTDTQYWFPDHDHSFVAVHPARSESLSDFIYYENTLKFTYTYPLANYKEATDVLIATHRRNYTDDNPTPVHFTFSHILSHFNIQVAYTNPNVDAIPLTVNEITFKYIPVEASYSVTPAKVSENSDMTYDYVNDPQSYYGWTTKRVDNLTIKFPTTGSDVRTVAPDGNPQQLFSATDALMLLPNPNPSTDLVVSYTTYDDNGAHPSTERLSIPQSWRPGLSYTLLISFTNGKVEFRFEVAEWKATDPINTTVPRK